MEPAQKATLKEKAIHEIKEYLFVSLYLWVFLGMFVEYKSLILSQQHIDFAARGIAAINALVLGKFLLIGIAFHPGRQAEDAPLIYPTLLKSALLAIIVMVLKIIEDIIVGHFHRKSVSESIVDLGGGSGVAILILGVMLFVVLIPITAFGELGRVVGEDKLRALFLRPRAPVSASLEPRT